MGRTSKKYVLWEHLIIQDGIMSSYPLNRDTSPVDIMVVGEGPGVSEDTLGRPFIGESGRLLRNCLYRTLSAQQRVAVTLTNILSCRPWAKAPTMAQNRAPAEAESRACAPRLMSLIAILKPKVILAAGNVPELFLTQMSEEGVMEFYFEKIRHPAWVLMQEDLELATSVYVEHLKNIYERRVLNVL